LSFGKADQVACMTVSSIRARLVIRSGELSVLLLDYF